MTMRQLSCSCVSLGANYGVNKYGWYELGMIKMIFTTRTKIRMGYKWLGYGVHLGGSGCVLGLGAWSSIIGYSYV